MRGNRNEAGTAARPTKTVYEAAVALFLFGCIPIAVRYVSANPFTIGIFRLAIATVFFFLFMQRKVLLSLSRRDWQCLAIIGVLFFCHWITYFLSIKMSSASVAAIGLSTYGIHLLILGVLTRRTRLYFSDVAAVVLAIAGAVLVPTGAGLSAGTLPGFLLAVLSAVFYAVLPILHQRYAFLSSSIRTFGQFAIALLVFLLFLPKADWDLAPRDWAGLSFLAFGSTLVGHSLWVRVTTRLSPATTSIIYYGNLPIAILLSAVILKEPITARIAMGACLIVGGSLLGLTYQKKRMDFPRESR